MIDVRDISDAARPLLERYGFSGATLFGSFARGTASESSDVDLLVDVPEGTKTKSVFAFAYDLGAALGVDVDAYGTHEVRPDSPFYRNVMSHGVSL